MASNTIWRNLPCRYRERPLFDHVLTLEGLKSDPKKVAAIEQMQPPTNKSKLETILGMVQYLSKFAPHLAEISTLA